MYRPPLTSIKGSGQVVRVALTGEVDVASREVLRTALGTALDLTADHGCLVIDLHEVEFLDACAVGVILRAGKAAADRSIEVQLRGDHGPVTLILGVTQTRQILATVWARSRN